MFPEGGPSEDSECRLRSEREVLTRRGLDQDDGRPDRHLCRVRASSNVAALVSPPSKVMRSKMKLAWLYSSIVRLVAVSRLRLGRTDGILRH